MTGWAGLHILTNLVIASGSTAKAGVIHGNVVFSAGTAALETVPVTGVVPRPPTTTTTVPPTTTTTVPTTTTTTTLPTTTTTTTVPPTTTSTTTSSTTTTLP